MLKRSRPPGMHAMGASVIDFICGRLCCNAGLGSYVQQQQLIACSSYQHLDTLQLIHMVAGMLSQPACFTSY